MEITGKVIVKNDTQQVSDKFAKREFVIETQETYPQQILVQLTQDKCALIDNVNVGDEVTAKINLRGRAWTNPEGVTKYFNSIECWALQLGATAPVSQPTSSEPKGVGAVDSDLHF